MTSAILVGPKQASKGQEVNIKNQFYQEKKFKSFNFLLF